MRNTRSVGSKPRIIIGYWLPSRSFLRKECISSARNP
jgi:hypothetical protein